MTRVVLDTSWLDVYRFPGDLAPLIFGNLIEESTGQTTPDGTLFIDLPAIPESDSGQVVTLEVIADDESGLPVRRAEVRVHPADFYSVCVLINGPALQNRNRV